MLNDLPDVFFQYRYFIADCIPDNIVIDTKISMNQSIAHTCYCPPFNVRVTLPY